MPKQKLYCYVDETGQDARSSVFIVVAVVKAGEQEDARVALTRIEQAAKTNQLKWHKTETSRRLKYLNLVLENHAGGEVFFGSFEKPLPFFFPMLEVIEAAIKVMARPPYITRIFVDGIDRKKAAELTNALRVRGVSLEMVRARRDESEALIRLADMWAGCIRAALSGRPDERAIVDRALRQNYLRRIQQKTP
jgi:hypothetical protein